ncbi:hypothetical protein A584_21773 [Pseudomonas syringae pv. theae ICMP 3923]|uniref:cupin domain-containing protein n=2 Tax=Pseudomonas syringae TaxID=317 RepID=UPI0003582B84|nr:cupin domain-containing protein [Pseudomonas syringae]EPM67334.1 hypothetical protein A584_21773 [Pseudomonas syringae pv. theae ICMP 3923]KPZ34625.1 hypothetical protein AN901_201286 [Pseudomonas syringae pv. theae]MBL3873918.1 cupin domain-containing protein [Pseudomonas syringae pv. theae]GKQ29500.1 hypothetical protein PSTH68_08295 [Pseudomonas syringae pv. theae]GKS08600.1 hypothetical protein PSTH1771_26310 [Pseudomonas syringae pv. theae]
MSKGFVLPVRKSLRDGIETDFYELNDSANTVIMISTMAPGAFAPSHEHDQTQIGMCLAGSFEMTVGGHTQQMDALKNCYWAAGGVPHEGCNNSGAPAVTLDIKRDQQASDVQLTCFPLSETFMEPSKPKSIKGGLDFWFFVGPWFEIMYSTLTPGALMPLHAHRGIQIGVGLTGSYTMEVGEISQDFRQNDVYFADQHVPHSGLNDTKENATSLNIFIPPRWNLLPIKDRPITL